MSEQNKVLLRRVFEEGLNQKKSSVIDELIAPGYKNYNMPTPEPGPKGFKQMVGMFQAAFPDFHVTIEDDFADGEKVGTRGRFTGTHKGEFMGLKPTGRKVSIEYIDIWRVKNGKFVENWVQMDMLGLMRQLGAIPAPKQAE